MAAICIDAPHQPDATTYHEARSTAAAYLESRLAAKNNTTADPDFVIPVIDISPSFTSSLAARQAVAEQIHAACTTSGFFYITNHGVPESACQGILTQAQRFFSQLPQEKKESLHIGKSKLGYGWEPSSYTSIAGDVETKEGFNFGYEKGLDKSGGDGKYKNLDGTTSNGNMWPEEKT